MGPEGAGAGNGAGNAEKDTPHQALAGGKGQGPVLSAPPSAP